MSRRLSSRSASCAASAPLALAAVDETAPREDPRPHWQQPGGLGHLRRDRGYEFLLRGLGQLLPHGGMLLAYSARPVATLCGGSAPGWSRNGDVQDGGSALHVT